MSEHEQHADRLEHELDDMQQQADRLGEEVDETRKDWERKQRDPAVPGATGDPAEDSGD
jgi:flagellar biosynthesis chaperone FliJ